MIEKDFCLAQVSRLAQLDKYPRTDQALNELVSALQNSPTREFASGLISGYCEYALQCPKPAEIRKEIFTATEQPPVTYPYQCPAKNEPSATELSLLDEINKARHLPYSKSELVQSLRLIPQEHRRLRRVELEAALQGKTPKIEACPCPSCAIQRTA